MATAMARVMSTLRLLAPATTMAPAEPIDARNDPWKKSMELSPIATVIPENATPKEELAVSVAVTVRPPAVLRVTLKVCDPASAAVKM